jgi:ABC-type antimicrobial peptide transport system permease subunit
VRTVGITSVFGAVVGAVVFVGLYLGRHAFTSRSYTVSDFPRRYVDYLPVRSGPGQSWWPVLLAAMGLGLVAGLVLGVVAAILGLRLDRRPDASG